MPGPRIDRQEQRKALEVIAELGPQTDYAVLSGSLPPGVPDGFYGEIGAVLSGHEVRIVLDSSGAALGKGLRNGAYLIKPNLRELGQLAGGGLDSEQHQVRAARRLVDSGKVQVVVLSLGSSGVLLVTGDDHRYLRSPTVPQRSRIGAGDSMVAGIVLSLARGEPLLEAVKFGIAAGASAVMTEGTELCRRETTEELYKDYASGE